MKIVADIKAMGNSLLLQTTQPIELNDGRYDVDIREIRSKRSLDQNAMLWGIICEISKSQYGDLSEKENIYLQLLEMAGAKYTILTLSKEAYEDKALDAYGIRNYREVGRGFNPDGKEFVSVIAFYGSSTMNTKEMTQLIDATIRYATNCGVRVDEEYWKGVLDGE